MSSRKYDGCQCLVTKKRADGLSIELCGKSIDPDLKKFCSKRHQGAHREYYRAERSASDVAQWRRENPSFVKFSQILQSARSRLEIIAETQQNLDLKNPPDIELDDYDSLTDLLFVRRYLAQRRKFLEAITTLKDLIEERGIITAIDEKHEELGQLVSELQKMSLLPEGQSLVAFYIDRVHMQDTSRQFEQCIAMAEMVEGMLGKAIKYYRRLKNIRQLTHLYFRGNEDADQLSVESLQQGLEDLRQSTKRIHRDCLEMLNSHNRMVLQAAQIATLQERLKAVPEKGS